jgi:hypothetical protein
MNLSKVNQRYRKREKFRNDSGEIESGLAATIRYGRKQLAMLRRVFVKVERPTSDYVSLG